MPLASSCELIIIIRMSPWISSLLAIAVVSGIPLAVTALLATQERAVRSIVPQLTALGSGALLGAATFHLIPEALAAGRTPFFVLVGITIGYLAFALVERMLASHDHAHSHGLELGAPESPHGVTTAFDGGAVFVAHGEHLSSQQIAARMVPLAFAGDAIHNLVDGMLIAAGFLANPGFGFLTAMAIGLHELPREVGTFGLFVHGGVHPLRAVAYNAFTAIVSFLGAAVTLLVGTHMASFGENILPFAAGSYVYIAVAVGIPSVVRQKNGAPRLSRALFLVAGFALMAVSALVR
ncbi:MAG: ZIP family metal transporter [Gemmatimonas sp.]